MALWKIYYQRQIIFSVGGATAYTFLKAKGFKTGNSPIDNEHLSWVAKALSKYGDMITLPTDHIVCSPPQDASSSVSASLIKGNIPDGMIGYSSQISAKRAGTIFWNGPMGLFEIVPL